MQMKGSLKAQLDIGLNFLKCIKRILFAAYNLFRSILYYTVIPLNTVNTVFPLISARGAYLILKLEDVVVIEGWCLKEGGK